MATPDRRILVGGLTDGEQETLDELVAQWRAKRPRNNLRAGFYDMKNATRHLLSANAPAEVKRRRYVLGWSSIAVDKLNRRCNLDGFYDPNGYDLGSLGLGELERENRLRGDLSQGGVSALIHAVSWLVTVFGDTSRGGPDVLILPRGAKTATGLWDVRRLVARDEIAEPVQLDLGARLLHGFQYTAQHQQKLAHRHQVEHLRVNRDQHGCGRRQSR